MRKYIFLNFRLSLLLVASQCFLWHVPLSAQGDQTCFMVTDSGEVVGLDHLCGWTRRNLNSSMIDVQELFERGSSLSRARQYDQALHVFSEVIRLEPMHTEAYVGRAVIRTARQEFQQAVEDYKRAAEIARSKGQIERADLFDDVVERYAGML